MNKPSIGVAGVGLMGSGMAGCFLSKGHAVHLLAHRSRRFIDPLLERGAGEAPDAPALVGRCDVLLTCLPNADDVAEFADTALPHFRAGQIWIDATTSRPELSAELAGRLAEQGAVYADAPVTGGPEQAREGALTALVGCAEDQFAAVLEVVSTYSGTVRRFGPPGRGQAAKLLNNLVTQGTMVLLADAFQAAARLGVDARALHDVMMGGAARSGTLQKAVTPALAGRFDGSKFTIANAAKDLRYARDLLDGLAPDRAALAAVLAERLGALEAQGRGDAFVSTMLDPRTAT